MFQHTQSKYIARVLFTANQQKLQLGKGKGVFFSTPLLNFLSTQKGDSLYSSRADSNVQFNKKEARIVYQANKHTFDDNSHKINNSMEAMG